MDHERIIYIYDYLSRYTDENHYVSISQIQEHLANACNLTRVKNVTIRRDLDRLTAMGNQIVKQNREHNTAYYALIGKGFSFNEIRFIVDSISINKFLTAFQKQTLIKKFEGMCSDAEIRQLMSRIVLNDRCPSTLDLLENLDKIHRLIGERQKIDFEYGKYDETTKQITYYYKKREMLPVSVIYFHERFYLKCLNEKDRKRCSPLNIGLMLHSENQELHKDYWKYTVPLLINQIGWGGGVTMYSVIMGHLGSDAVAANSIASIVRSMIASLCWGIASGVGIIIGGMLGRNELDEAKKAGGSFVRFSILIGAASGVVILALTPLILHIIHLEPQAQYYLKFMMFMAAYYIVGNSLNSTIISGIFPSGGDTKFGMWCDLITLWCVVVPMGMIGAYKT